MKAKAAIALFIVFAAWFLGSCQHQTVGKGDSSSRPNLLLIVVDDMGFSDLGAFGSEIPTPNLDALAFAGVRFTNFVTYSVCSPTRASLLTGVDPHVAGLGNMAEDLSPNQRGQPGYEGYLNERVVTIASLLRDAGYSTYMTGKWHLGATAETDAYARGFDRSFSMSTNASHFDDMRPAYSPDPDAKAAYRQDGQLLAALPEDFEYSSQFYVDRMMEYIRDGEPGTKPFFAYLAFSAPHWPLQAPDEVLEVFRGRYADGYDLAAERRLAALKRLGLISPVAELADRSLKGQPWRELGSADQDKEQRRMEVYAAMVAEIDRHSGRLIEFLREEQLLDNTIVVFISDNGAEGHDLDDIWPVDAYPAERAVIDGQHDFSLTQMGRPGSYSLYGPNWARVSAPAFRLFKGFPTEGGTRTLAFAYYPQKFKAGSIVDELVLVKDIVPTLLELTGVQHPGTSYRGRSVEPLSGVSAVTLLSGGQASVSGRIHVDEMLGKFSVRKAQWKLLKTPRPHGTGEWELFDLSRDLGEKNDLSLNHPEIVLELEKSWLHYRSSNNVILPDQPSTY